MINGYYTKKHFNSIHLHIQTTIIPAVVKA